MSIESPENLKAQYWELGTVSIRLALRYLNNKIKRVIPPTVLASAKHELCYQLIIKHFNADQMEEALNWLRAQEATRDAPEKISDTLTDDNYKREEQLVRDMRDDNPRPPTEPTDPIAKALMQPIMAAIQNRLDKLTVSFDHALRTGDSKVRSDVGEAITELANDINTKLHALEDALMVSQGSELTILFPDAEKKELGLVHKQQALLIKYLMAGCHVFLTGPAGSGKSTAGEKAAEALSVKFGEASCCSQDTATKFLGYLDATGTYHTTEFREAYAKGGLFVLDEIDAGNPNVLAVLNSALSGHQCAFPDGMVKRHDKFRCIATGNTWGTGKTVQYVGRNAIDAATLNRFVVIYWDYDEALETSIAGMPGWSSYVQKCRAEIKRRGINYLITPRASIHGARALKVGIELDKVIENVLFPNLDPEIRRHMPEPPALQEIK